MTNLTLDEIEQALRIISILLRLTQDPVIRQAGTWLGKHTCRLYRALRSRLEDAP